MRILIYTILSLALAATAFGQDGAKGKSQDETVSEGTLSTPFGIAKTTKAPASEEKPKAAKVLQNWQVEKAGKDFKFTKKTPFGPSSWTRAESELSDDERAVAEHRGLLKAKEEPAAESDVAAKQL